MNSQLAIYKDGIISRYWAYQQRRFPQHEKYFERPMAADGRPPVFLTSQADNNIITKPDASEGEIGKLLNLIPSWERHKWFRSMNSSQALAQSVFGNLAVYDQMEWLAELYDDNGDQLFDAAKLLPDVFFMEHKVKHLGEPRPTSLDGFFAGSYQVAIECKFTETEVGACSRPILKPTASNYDADFCDGSFTQQRGRHEKCSLTEIGVLYWHYVPRIFNWSNDVDLKPCPLNKNYQLVRNILAISVLPNRTVSPSHGHVVLIYDDRNPAFQFGGDGYIAYTDVKSALLVPKMLRKCSWQHILQEASKRRVLPWLTEQLAEKYAF